uniref:Uncharacterized protein n=2 Tax=Rhizobium/Agrobacterium group TaxID=227290 RepID=A0A2Z2Q378_AGRTU|nr:hypothetical protein [Agrobacterium radiobacter]
MTAIVVTFPVCSGRAHRVLDDGVKTDGDRRRTARGRNEVEDGRERLSWPARNANLFAGEESCVWPLRPRRSRRRRPSVTPDQSRSAWVWLSEPDRPRHAARLIVELTTSTPLARSFSAPCSHYVTAADLPFPSTPSPMRASALPPATAEPSSTGWCLLPTGNGLGYAAIPLALSAPHRNGLVGMERVPRFRN